MSFCIFCRVFEVDSYLIITKQPVHIYDKTVNNLKLRFYIDCLLLSLNIKLLFDLFSMRAKNNLQRFHALNNINIECIITKTGRFQKQSDRNNRKKHNFRKDY